VDLWSSILYFQSEIRNLERTRESMAKEIADLSQLNDTLEEKIKEMPHLQEQYQVCTLIKFD